jgi:LDH2 family malate/lactate/ureidoglycolate dehydrogenase
MTQAGGISVAADELRALVARLLIAAGIQEAAARTTAGALVDADLEGMSSHGVMLMDMYIERIRKGSVSREATATVVSDKGAAVVLDARLALGQPTGDQAMRMALERARQYGAGISAVRHGFHFGTARRYALQAATADCIGISMCNTRPLMPAPGGAEALVGNNPIAIAFPSDGPIPIVLDMATSEAAMGKIRMAQKGSQAIPETWAVKFDGSPTTSPADAIAGMLLPTGGAKGFGLAFVIDLLCGLLSGGASGSAVRPLYGDPAIPYDCSHLFIAIDVAHFCDPAVVRRAAAAAADRIRTSKRAAGVPQLYAPGEPEWRCRERAGDRVELAPAVAEMLNTLARELGVSPMPLAPEAGQPMEEARHAQA